MAYVVWYNLYDKCNYGKFYDKCSYGIFCIASVIMENVLLELNLSQIILEAEFKEFKPQLK